MVMNFLIGEPKMNQITRILYGTLMLALALTACEPAAVTRLPDAIKDNKTPHAESASDELIALKEYVINQSDALYTSVTQLKNSSDSYYHLVEALNFDYQALWDSQSSEVMHVLSEARKAFLSANPHYEQMEGVVAGVPDLSQYDLILDAGTSLQSGADDAVPFDLTLPNGEVLPKPGNLFEVTEAALWGSDPQYVIANIHPDYNNNGMVDLGETLPDANVLKGTADAFQMYSAELATAVRDWQPTLAEAFGALLANIPTFSDFMESWKNSRYVMGAASTERGFIATSRLSDLSDNILSWQKIYAGLSPSVQTKSPEQDAQIIRNLENLQNYVSDLFIQESEKGKKFSPEEVDILNAEGQDRANAIAGQIAQVAAQLNIPIEVE
jgi:hypothetical protein